MSYKISYHERADGTSVLQYSGDAQGLVDHCAEYARGCREEGVKNGLQIGARKMMSIDPVVAMDLAQKRGMDFFNPELWDLFRDRDYSKFRCIDDKRYFRRK